MTARQRAGEWRQADMAAIKILYPSLSWQQIGRMIRNARHVRLLGGKSLETALGR